MFVLSIINQTLYKIKNYDVTQIFVLYYSICYCMINANKEF